MEILSSAPKYLVRFSNMFKAQKFFGPYTTPKEAYDAAVNSIMRRQAKGELERYEVSFSGLRKKIVVTSPDTVPYRFDVVQDDTVPYEEKEILLSSCAMDRVERLV